MRTERELVRLDLGPAAEVERAVQAWLAEVVSLRGIAAGGEDAGSGAAGTRVWQPIDPHLEGIRVFVRADSFLGTLPFGVIPLDDGEYLIERKGFVYVQTPRDAVGRTESRHGERGLALDLGRVRALRRVALTARARCVRSVSGPRNRIQSAPWNAPPYG